jgi:ABC-type dipeptide/oligopeptide/nickel transport system permease component
VNYFLRRLMLTIPTLFALSFLVFFLLELTPGSAASAVLDDASSGAAKETLCQQLRCDQPLLSRYAAYLGDVLQGDMGVSIRSGREVSEELRLRLPHTLIVSAGAVAVAVVIGSLVGLIAAVKQGTLLDIVITAALSVSAAMPTFWVALLLVSLFAVRLGWLPVFGSGSVEYYILPVFSVALALIPGIAVLVRSSILEIRGQTYIAAAYGKGLSNRRVYWRHIRPVAAVPVVTYVGLQAVHLVGSLVAIEVLFNLPGLGGLAVQAALDRDPMLLQGAVLTIAVFTLGILLLVDVIVLLLDPRISSRQI